MNFGQSNQHQMHPQPFLYPPFYPTSYQDMMRSQTMSSLQNMQAMQFMRNPSSNQNNPSFMGENLGAGQFSFPFNPQQMQMPPRTQQQDFNQGQMMGARNAMVGQQVNQKDIKK